MTIPLQPLDIAQYRYNPMATAEQMGLGIDQMGMDSARTNEMKQQTANQKALLPYQQQSMAAQSQLEKAQAQQAAQRYAMLQKYPELAFGQSGQNMASIDYLMSKYGKSGQMGTPPPQTSTQPQTQPQPQPQAQPPAPLLPQENNGIMGQIIPSVQSITSGQPQTSLGTPTQTPAVQGGTPAQGSIMAGSNFNEADAFAQQQINKFMRNVHGVNAQSFGLNIQNPYARNMINAMLRKQYPMGWEQEQTAMLPMRMFEYEGKAQQEADVAALAGLGLTDYTTASRYLESGGSVAAMAQHLGVDPSLINRLYPPSSSLIGQSQKAGQSANVEEALNGIMTQWSSPFAGYVVKGKSPKMIHDELLAQTGGNQVQIARALAANALQPELSAGRINAMGQPGGIKMVEKTRKDAMGNLEGYRTLVSSQTYAMMQRNVNLLINLANTARQHYLSSTRSESLTSKQANQRSTQRVNLGSAPTETPAAGQTSLGAPSTIMVKVGNETLEVPNTPQNRALMKSGGSG